MTVSAVPTLVQWGDETLYLVRFPTSRSVVPSQMQRQRAASDRLRDEAQAIIEAHAEAERLARLYREVEEIATGGRL